MLCNELAGLACRTVLVVSGRWACISGPFQCPNALNIVCNLCAPFNHQLFCGYFVGCVAFVWLTCESGTRFLYSQYTFTNKDYLLHLMQMSNYAFLGKGISLPYSTLDVIASRERDVTSEMCALPLQRHVLICDSRVS